MNGFDLSTISSIYVGSTQYSLIYMGSNKLWPVLNTLPYDVEVEYLEATGTQYIDTNKIYNGSYRFEVKFVCNSMASPEDNNSASIFGSRVHATNSAFQLSTFRNGSFAYYNNLNLQVGLAANTEYVVELRQDNKLYINNVEKLLVSNISFSSPSSILLFALHQNSTITEKFIGKIYYFKLYDINNNNNVVLDLIPVRVGQTGYMYDRVSGLLYGNDGTGSFTLGPDIVEIEYLESTGTQYINTNVLPIYNYGLSGEIKMQRTGNSTGEKAFIGRTSAGGFDLYTKSDLGIGLWVDRGTSSFEVVAGSTYFDKNIHTITFNITPSISYLSVDGNQYSVTDNANATSACPIQLFSHRGYYNAEGRIYYCKLYYNATLIHDLIPVRVGQVGYMYDKVTGRLFGNSGTGSFVLGPDEQ